MNAPYDTALLKHMPDHLTPLTEAERAVENLAQANRQTFREFVAQIFSISLRHGQAELPRQKEIACPGIIE